MFQVFRPVVLLQVATDSTTVILLSSVVIMVKYNYNLISNNSIYEKLSPIVRTVYQVYIIIKPTMFLYLRTTTILCH